MKSILMAFLFAMSTTAVSVTDALRPMAFLAGHCWKGAFPDGKTTDTHCYTWIYGDRFLRDVHVVEGRGEPYCGETIYHVDPDEDLIRFTYYNSLDGISRGTMEETDEGLFSPAEEYDGPKGEKILIRSWLVPSDDGDGYRILSESKREGGWEQVLRVEFGKRPDMDPATALSGACAG